MYSRSSSRSAARSSKSRAALALVGTSALMLAVQSASAVVYTWSNGDANAQWDTTSNNWTNGGPNTPWVNDTTNPNAALFSSATSPTGGIGTVNVTGTTTATPILGCIASRLTGTLVLRLAVLVLQLYLPFTLIGL